MGVTSFLLKSPLKGVFKKLIAFSHFKNIQIGFIDFENRNKNKGIINDFYTNKIEYKKRYTLHKKLIEKYNLKDKIINYFEFGVANGEMLSFWLSQNKNSTSKFIGYDSFEGLPEVWENKKEGHFSRKGILPNIEDERVTFVKGWFQESLYKSIKHLNVRNISIFHLDADLFTSTLFVLFNIHPLLKKGDFLIFDEYSSILHEYQAFEIFKRCCGQNVDFQFVGAVNNYRQVAYVVK